MKKNDLDVAAHDAHDREQLLNDLDFVVMGQLWSDLLDEKGDLGDIMRGATPIKKEVVTENSPAPVPAPTPTPEQFQPQIALKTAIEGAIFVMLISGITSLAVVSTFYVSVMR